MALLVPAWPASATEIDVTTTVDELNADGDCSLREAIQAANTDDVVDGCNSGAGDDVIDLAALTYTISGSGPGEDLNQTGDLDISTNVSIQGEGSSSTVIVESGDLDRVLHVVGNTLALTDLRVSGGVAEIGGGIFNGGTTVLQNVTVSENLATGADAVGGGIYNSGVLTLQSAVVTQNDSSGTGVNRGGGIYNDGSLTLTTSLVTFNEVTHEGAGIYSTGAATLDTSTVDQNAVQHATSALTNGGGIYNKSGTLILTASNVTNNDAKLSGGGIFSTGTATITGGIIGGNDAPGTTDTVGGGGGIFNSGTLNLTEVDVTTNATAGEGAGIENMGTANVTRTTVRDNTANTAGGGIDSFGANGNLTLSNSTVSGNTANGGQGGGVLNGATATIANSTIAANTASGAGGGVRIQPGDTVTMGSTIVANNTGLPAGDCSGSVTSTGYNLIENASGCTIGGTITGNLIGMDPLLENLGGNGGPTLTHSLDPASPAIETGDPACPAPATDQRGVNRPQGTSCDIGAFEVEGVPDANADGYDTNEDTPLAVPVADGVLDNDTDTAPGSNPLEAAVVDQPDHDASFALDANGSFSYTPDANFNGADTFTYRVSDGTYISAPVTVTIDVAAVNDAPVGAADQYATNEDTPLAVNGVLDNDTDLDGGALTAVLVSGPANTASFTLNANGSFSYTPAPDFNGADSFGYRASDGNLMSAVTTVTINVAPVDEPAAPAAPSDPAGGGSGAPATPVAAQPALRIPGRQRLGSLRSRGLALSVSCQAACRIAAELLLDRRSARRLGLAAAPRPVRIGRGSARLTAAGRATLRARLTRRAARRLRSARSVKLTLRVTVTDGAGARTTLTRRVTIRR